MSCRTIASTEFAAPPHFHSTVSAALRAAAVPMLLLLALPLQAATLDWDPNADGSLSDASGNWDTAIGNWWTGAADQAWNNGNNDTAQFGTGAGGVAPFTATLAEPIQVGGLIFQNQSYSIAGNTLTLGGATAPITANVNATISSAIAGSALLVKQGPGTLALAGLNTSSGGRRSAKER